MVETELENGSQERAGGEEGEARDTDLVAEIVCPSKEEVGDERNGGRLVRTEPEGDRVAKLAKRGHDREVAGVSEVFNVFDAGRERRVGREREDDGGYGGGMSGEERRKVLEVLGSDDDGDVDSTKTELVS